MIECDYGVFHDTVLVGLGFVIWCTILLFVCCQSGPFFFFFFFFLFFCWYVFSVLFGVLMILHLFLGFCLSWGGRR